MNESLTGILALLGSRLNERARASFLQLLPPPLADEVADRLRKGGDLAAGSLSETEQVLLDQLQDPEAESGEEASGSAGDASPSLLATLLGLLCLSNEPEAAAPLLVALPGFVLGPVVCRMVTGDRLELTRGLDGAQAEPIEDLRAALKTRAVWGVDPTCKILRAIDSDRGLNRVLAATAAVDEEVVGALQNHLFVFEDLLRLRDPELQALMLQVDNTTLARALRMTSDQVRQRLVQNVSARRARLIGEEEELCEDATLEEIEQAQGDVLNAVRKLYDQGKISTYFGSVQQGSRPEGGGEEEVVREPGEEAVEERAEEEGAPEEGRKPEPTVENNDWKRRFVLGCVLGGVLMVVWLVVGKLSDSSNSSSDESAAPREQVSKGPAKGRRTTAAVQVEGEAGPSGEQQAPPAEQADAPELSSGQTLKTGELKAVLQFPGVPGRVEVGEQTEVSRIAGEEEKGPDELYLRVGRVRVRALDQGFYVRSPLVRVSGEPGAIFTVRVVLDGTTIVEVEEGEAKVVSSLADKGEEVVLTRGQRGRFKARSN